MKQKKIWLYAVSFLIIFCLFAPTLYAQEQEEGQQQELSPEEGQKMKDAIKQHRKRIDETRHPKVAPVLTDLEDEYKKGGEEGAKEFAKKRALKIKEGNKIRVDVRLKPGTTLEEQDKKVIEQAGGNVIKGSRNSFLIDIPIDKIRKIADEVEDIRFIDLPAEPTLHGYRSEGLSKVGFSNYSAAGIRGSGAKIGVIDTEFAGLTNAQNNKELPSNVIQVDCTPATGCASTTFSEPANPTEEDKHGTAVAEIVYDMAKDAQLYLMKIANLYDLEDAIDYSGNNGINVINLSMGWFNQNFYDGSCDEFNPDNPVCTAISAYAKGILLVNSIGNQAKKHYAATYIDGGYDCHSTMPKITADPNETIKVYLTWNAWPTDAEDYDLYLFGDTGDSSIYASSTSDQTGTQSPTEALSLTQGSSSGTYRICVSDWNTTSNHDFKVHVVSNKNLSTYTSSKSLTNPSDADAPYVLSVGAINHYYWETGPQESFSSQGPTTDGRIKPEIMGPDYVSTYTYGTNGFPGTSAAAPHVAGAAALMLSQNQNYTVSQLWSALTGSAVDMGSSGQDNIYGYGRLNLPTVYKLNVSKGGIGDGTVTSSPSGINCGTDCIGGFDYGTLVTLTATPNDRSKFSLWSGACSGTNSLCSITMNTDKNVTAYFDGKPVISETPASYDFGSIYGSANTFTVTNVGLADLSISSISLTGTNASDFNISFTYDNCSGHSLVPYNSCTFTVELLPTSAGTKSAAINISSDDPDNGTLSVPLSANVPYTYTISTTAGSGGTISPSSTTVNFNDSKTFTIDPDPGYHIADVKVDGVSVSGYPTTTDTSYSLTISNTKTAHSISATFSNTYKLTISKSGIGAGTVTGSTGGLSCGAICSNSITQGTFVSLTASADADSTFVGWSGCGCSGTGSCDVTLNGDTTVMAAFTAPYIVISEISAGGDYSVALRNSGMLWDWGGNASGQLGDGTTTQKLTPVQSATGKEWIAVSAGYSHTVAIRNDGTLWAWGDNSYGQLGDNTTVNRSSPVQIGSDTRWAAVSAGAYHTVALKTDGTLWAWGYNWFGQLGDGSYTDRHLPVKIGADTNWTSIAAGNWHTVAVKNDGTLWAWGANWYGQIGDGTITDRSSPVKIGADTDWAAITTGDSHTLALKANKTLWAWGYNEDGELGDNTTTERHSPVRIGSDSNWSEISAGDWHTLALKTDGTLWAWGYNYDGELGNGTTNDAWSPIQISGNTWKAVSAGSLHSIAVRSDGTLWGWGANESGQVGDGTTMDRPSPVQVNFQTYTLTAIAGTGGAISPAGTMTVSYGAIQTFTVAPNTGYHVTSVTGCGGTLSGNTYTTGPITADCTVSATFASASSYVRILGKGNYSTLQAAYDATVEGDTIQSQAMTFTENLTTNRNISVTIDGGYNADFSSNPTITNLTGIVIISSGTVTMKNFNLQY